MLLQANWKFAVGRVKSSRLSWNSGINQSSSSISR